MKTKNFQLYNPKNKVVEEAYSFLKANFTFSNVDKKYKNIAVLSVNPKEGKTTVAINFAINVARSGMKVLLVDTDLRKPVRGKRLGEDSEKGLSDYLIEGLYLKDVIVDTNIENLNYLPSGVKVVKPVELLSSNEFKQFISEANEKYDLLIFDTPALSSVTDGYIIASNANASFLVVRSGSSDLVNLKKTKEYLNKANANVLGVVFNRVTKAEYRKNFGGYDYFNKKKILER
ncbi:CpsD/CapB family tyrosine-protein kinase [Clostridium akagii]|uniref:CpsD/CapB family tyrosine-protein kinase n=1 Tax=Clostridium akagii TaxID=91623 RepID=UPI0005691283|nr:CpsD/CapB family tyrosine-protein kinase [Clostridium akagii]